MPRRGTSDQRAPAAPSVAAVVPVTVTVFDPAPILEVLARLEAEVRDLRREVAQARDASPTGRAEAVAESALLRESQVVALVSYSARTLRAWVSAGRFPKPVRQPGDQRQASKRWLRCEVEAWIAERAGDRTLTRR